MDLLEILVLVTFSFSTSNLHFEISTSIVMDCFLSRKVGTSW
jgi:hypothetical protein